SSRRRPFIFPLSCTFTILNKNVQHIQLCSANCKHLHHHLHCCGHCGHPRPRWCHLLCLEVLCEPPQGSNRAQHCRSQPPTDCGVHDGWDSTSSIPSWSDLCLCTATTAAAASHVCGSTSCGERSQVLIKKCETRCDLIILLFDITIHHLI
ncbi:hypothetical protein BC829DRAFT_493973, partial [Chytridium lagenaria]